MEKNNYRHPAKHKRNLRKLRDAASHHPEPTGKTKLRGTQLARIEKHTQMLPGTNTSTKSEPSARDDFTSGGGAGVGIEPTWEAAREERETRPAFFPLSLSTALAAVALVPFPAIFDGRRRNPEPLGAGSEQWSGSHTGFDEFCLGTLLSLPFLGVVILT
jgi:hypothetical protein